MNQKNPNQQLGRRHFLRSTAMIGGGMMLASKSMAQTKGNESLNVALIGAGSQGQALLNTCMKMEGIRMKAICDIWESYNLDRASKILTGFQQEHATYTDYQEMLAQEKDLQAVIIATPDCFHAEQTVACLNAGLNVYCESMMSNTLEGAKEMVKTAQSTGKLLQIGHQRRSNPFYRYSYDHVINETKMLGKVTALNGQWNRAVQSDRGFPRRASIEDAILNKYGFASMQQFRNWEWYKNLGNGPIATLGIHQIDVFNWFMGTPPSAVMAIGGTDYYDAKSHEWYDTVMAIFDYTSSKDNIRALYQTLSANSNFGFYENFLGDQGTLYLSEASARVKVYREPAAPDWDKWVKIGILKSDDKEIKEAPKEEKKESSDAVLDIKESVLPPSYNLPIQSNDPVCKPHLQNFFNAIQGKEKLNCPAEVAFASNVVILKINQSIQESRRIDFQADDFQV